MSDPLPPCEYVTWSSAEVDSPVRIHVPSVDDSWNDVELDADEAKEADSQFDDSIDEHDSNIQSDTPEPDSADSHLPTNHPQPEELTSHVSMHIPGEPDSTGEENKWNSPTYLHTYFKFLYAIGVSRYRVEGAGGHFILTKLQLLVFLLVSVLAFVQALEYLKYFCLLFAEHRELLLYAKMGLEVFYCMSTIYFVKFVAFDTDKISSMLDSLQWNFEITGEDNRRQSHRRNTSVSRVALLLGITSFIIALFETIFGGYNIKSILMGKPILGRSYEFSEGLFVWRTNQSNLKDELYDEYGTELTPLNVAFGLMGFLVDYCGALQHNAVRDLILLAALTLYEFTKRFEATLETTLRPASERGHTGLDIDEEWKNFKTLQSISSNISNTLGALISMLHIKNLLLFTTFLLSLLERSNSRSKLFFRVVGLAKVMTIYIIAAKISRVNQLFRTWIHKRSCNRNTLKVGSIKANCFMLLDEIDNEPVGLGKDVSFLSVSFIVKFLGYVASCFLFFAKNDACE